MAGFERPERVATPMCHADAWWLAGSATALREVAPAQRVWAASGWEAIERAVARVNGRSVEVLLMDTKNLGVQPKPRVLVKVSKPMPGRSRLVQVTSDKESILESVKGLVGTCREISSSSEVRLEEWDACLHLDPNLDKKLLDSMPCFCPAAFPYD